MIKLFESLKGGERPLTVDEIQLAANALAMDSPAGKEILRKLNARDGSIAALLQKPSKKEVSH
ncbi:MAG TPA: hypothetical protein VGO47_10045 [Chlamydiales bacterium]|jgi:hypothetical protein|nr:hypothetical protein [Chlamydiales bacterium]